MTHARVRLIPLCALCAATLLGCGSVAYGPTPQAPLANAPRVFGTGPGPATAEISIEVFYEELAPYGEWMDAPRVGRVFVPHDPEYRPYQNGRWVQREDGLVWVSYDAIGWAVCHYGSWAVLDDQRWAWVPDTEWGPGWVEWRENSEYVGWSPRMAYVAPTVPAQTTWVFVQTTYLLASYVSQSFLAPPAVASVYNLCPPMQARPNRAWIRSRGVRRARPGSMRLPSATTPGSRPRRAAAGGRGEGRSRPAASGGYARAGGRPHVGGGYAERVAPPARRPHVRGGYAVRTDGPARSGLVARPRLRDTVVLGGSARQRRPDISGPGRPQLTLTGPPRPGPAPRTIRPALRQPSLPHPAVRRARQIPPRPSAQQPPRIVRPMPSAPPPSIVRAPQPRIAPTPPPRVVRPQVTAPRVTAPRVTAPRVTTPRVTRPAVTAPRVTRPTVRAPRVTRPTVSAPRVTAPRVARPAPRPSRPRVQRRTSPSRALTPTRARPAVTAPGVRIRR